MTNVFSFEVSIYSVIISIALRIIAAIFYAIVAYRAYKESGVRNGLIKLRFQLLTASIVLFIINTVGTLIVFIRFFISADIARLFTETISFSNSIGFLIVGYIFFKIYTQSYSNESKSRHKRIATLERADKARLKK